MKLLVITPTLGRSPFLRETLKSVGQIKSPNLHVIVGPASSEESVESAVELSARKPVFVAERQNAGGLYQAINQAVCEFAEIAWTHFTYINDDDLLGKDFSEEFARHIAESPEAFGYGNVELTDDSGRSIGRVPTESKPRYFEALLAQGISPFNQQGMIVPRKLWDALGGFRTEFRLSADLDFWLRAHRARWPFRYYARRMGVFRINPGQLSADTTRLSKEIRAVYNSGCPRKISSWEARYAKWRFRTMNADVYLQRLFQRKALSGMKMLAGK